MHADRANQLIDSNTPLPLKSIQQKPRKNAIEAAKKMRECRVCVLTYFWRSSSPSPSNCPKDCSCRIAVTAGRIVFWSEPPRIRNSQRLQAQVYCRLGLSLASALP